MNFLKVHQSGGFINNLGYTVPNIGEYVKFGLKGYFIINFITEIV